MGVCLPRRLAFTCLLVAWLTACTAVPDGLEPVRGFETERYLGRWYEIARLDHSFERGLSRVTADYSRRDDGGIRVLNRGYDETGGAWKEAEGKAYTLGEADVASLKVSFFGPFYGGYHVIALDPGYRWALVAGPSRDYLWILARAPELDPAIYARLVAQADAGGFPVEQLIRVNH
jgi:apolipoprotein D and lipocalin family protein